ncbi:MAG: hypothetical protein GY927_13185 [bacterium]|nr:hypothetical protein [bacterium]
MSETTDNNEKSEALKQIEEQAAILAQQQAIAESQKAIAEANEKSEAIKQIEEQAAILAQQQAIAESEKAIAEANKAKLAATLPAGSPATPPEGSITTDDKFGYLAELVAYDTLTRQVREMVTQLEKTGLSPNSKILLVEDLNMATADVQLLQVKHQLAALDKGLTAQIRANEAHFQPSKAADALQPKGIAEMAALTPALAATTAVVGSVANIANMFRVDYTVKGKEIKLSDKALRALVAGKWKKCPVYLPNFYRITASELLKTFAALDEKRWSLQAQVQRLRQQLIAPNKQRIAALKTELKAESSAPLKAIKQAEIDTLETTQKEMEAAAVRSESLITVYDASSKALLTAAAGQTASPLVTAILREKITTLGITHLLYATVVSSGGEAITSKRWFTSGHTAYLGGSVVSYILATVEGDIVAADTLVTAGRLEYKMGSKDVPTFGSE